MDVARGLQQAAQDEHEWTPVLVVGKKLVTQTAITSSGNLAMPTTYQDTVSMAHGVTKGLGQALGGAFDAGPSEPARPGAPAPTPGSYLTATWLEYEIQSPGGAGAEDTPRRVRSSRSCRTFGEPGCRAEPR